MSKKVLFLHGFAQNGSVFAAKSNALRKALNKIGYEAVYLNAPITVSPADMPFEPAQVDSDANDTEHFKSWWPSNEAKPGFYSVETAFEAIKQSVQENGPYDGIVGFSQGSGLASVLCAAIHKLDQYTKPAGDSTHPGTPPADENYKQKNTPLKFAILYSGFRVKPDYLQHWFDTPLTVPSLHVLGSLDTLVSEERSMAMYDLWDPKCRSLLVHPGGHYVPNAKPLVNAVINFVSEIDGGATQINGKDQKNSGETKSVNSAEPAEPQNDWDMFDKIGRS